MQPWSSLSSARMVVSLLAVGMALCACGVTVTVNDLSLPAPAITPLPLMMGLYFPPGLRTARNSGEHGDHTYEFSIGPGTIAGFEAAAAAMFEDVVPVQQLPGLAANTNAPAGTIEVSAARGTYFPSPVQERARVFVTYDIVLYGADGEKRAAWSVVGSSYFQKDWSATTRAAMRDAVASWMAGFQEQKDVRPWLETIGAAPPAAAPTPEGGS
jgi:hypothetical protein